MSGTYGLNEKQLWLLRNGVMLTGETYQNKERIKKFMADRAFYFGDRYSNGDKHWYAHPDKVDELVALIPDLGYIPSRHAPVSKNTYRYDCKDSKTGLKYDINNDEHWHTIHVTKPGTNVKDTAKSNQNLVCPEDGCNIKFKTVMGSKERALHRKKFERNCEKCGKISTPPEAESSDPPDYLKYVYTPGAIPRNARGVFAPPPPDPEPEFTTEPSLDSVPPDLVPVEVPQLEPVAEEPPPTPDEPAVVPEPDMDRPDLIPDVEPPVEEKTTGRRELTKEAWALGALVLIVLVLWVFIQ